MSLKARCGKAGGMGNRKRVIWVFLSLQDEKPGLILPGCESGDGVLITED